MKTLLELAKITNPTEQFEILVEDAFYSKTYDKVVVVKDDEKLHDVFANVVLENEVSDELLNTLFQEWYAEELA